MKHLLELRPCDNCGGAVQSLFYVVRASLASVNVSTVNQFLGMHQFFGGRASSALVENFVPDAARAITVAGDEEPELMTELVICHCCFYGRPLDLPRLTEALNDRRRKAVAARREAADAR